MYEDDALNLPHQEASWRTMVSSRPMLLLVVTLLMLIFALATFWFAALPHRLQQSFATQLQQDTGFVLEARAPSFSFRHGPTLQLKAVSLGDVDQQQFVMSAEQINLELGWASLFGAGYTASNIDIASPVITVDLAKPLRLPVQNLAGISLRDASLRLIDSNLNAVIAVSDLNGTIATGDNDSTKLNFSFLQNGITTALNAELADADKLASAGTPIDMTLASKGNFVGFSGRARFAEQLAYDGVLTAEGEDAGPFLTWAGIPLSSLTGSGHITFTSSLSSQGLTAKLPKLVGQLGEAVMKGDITIATGVDRARLTGQLTSDRLAIWSAAEPGSLARPWSEKALQLDEYAAADLDLTFTADKVVLRKVDLGAMAIELKLDGGKGQMDARGPKLLGGAAQFSSDFTALRGLLSANIKLDGTAVELGELVPALTGQDIAHGRADVKASLKASGRNWASLISSLAGSVDVKGDAISVLGVDLQDHMTRGGNNWAKLDAPSLRPGKADLSWSVADGIAALVAGRFVTNDISLAPKGEIDLLRQAFNLELRPSGKGVNPKMRLNGYWTSPVFAPTTGNGPLLRPSADLAQPGAAVAPPAN